MESNKKKVKIIIFSAILAVVFLLVVSICEIISISAMKQKIEKQNNKIEELNRQIDYYKNSSDDDKNFDNIIIEGE